MRNGNLPVIKTDKQDSVLRPKRYHYQHRVAKTKQKQFKTCTMNTNYHDDVDDVEAAVSVAEIGGIISKRNKQHAHPPLPTKSKSQQPQPPQRHHETTTTAGKPSSIKYGFCTIFSHQVLLLIILFLLVVRIQIFNCNVILKEYHDSTVMDVSKTRHATSKIKNDDNNNINSNGDSRPRILIGIFTTDTNDGYIYRRRHRTLFRAWNDTRICSLSEYNTKVLTANTILDCEFIYTFVIGANPNGMMELVSINTTDDNTTNDSWLVPRLPPISSSSSSSTPNKNLYVSRDINDLDITLLNVKENMNDGKSQSWIAYASSHQIYCVNDGNDDWTQQESPSNKNRNVNNNADAPSTIITNCGSDYSFDYIAKWDADSVLLLPEYFDFVYSNLPKHPYNSMIFMGTPFDKLLWEPSDLTDHFRFESLYETYYNKVHIYFGGQLYMMAMDLAKMVTTETIRNHCSYCVGVEDHDISTIAFHATADVTSSSSSSITTTESTAADKEHRNRHHKVLKLLFIGYQDQFWEHPIKTNDEWDRIWQREKKRINMD